MPSDESQNLLVLLKIWSKNGGREEPRTRVSTDGEYESETRFCGRTRLVLVFVHLEQ